MRSVRRRISARSKLNAAGAKRLIDVEGARFWAGSENKIEAKLLDGDYDAENLSLCRSLIGRGDICFDIGANIGVYSVTMARLCGAEGRVHAFEPVAHVRQRLYWNVLANNLQNVVITGRGVGAQRTTLTMNQVRANHFRGGTSTFTENENVASLGADSFERVEVEVVPLDSYVEEVKIDRIRFIKIDVEGFEIEVLRGAMNSLRRFRPILLMEHNQRRLKHLGIEEAFFSEVARDANYSFFEVSQVGGESVVTPFAFDRRLPSLNLIGLPNL